MPPSNIPSWVSVRPSQPPTIVQHWDGLPSVTLSAIPGGARLLWVFEEDYPDQLGVFVHLTDYEAQEVFTTPSDIGLLEGIRPRLRDRDAFVWRKSGDLFGTESYRIPKRGQEPEFAESMWEAAEAVELILDLRFEKARASSKKFPHAAFSLSGVPDSPAIRASRQLARAREQTLFAASARA